MIALPIPCGLIQASFAFNVLEEALRLILEKMEDLSSLAAETGRLAGLLAALTAADIDAGGDGTVVGFGSIHQQARRGNSKSGQLGMPAAVLLHSKDSNLHDVELADRSETAQLLHGMESSTGAGAGAISSSSSNGVLPRSTARLSRVLRLLNGSEPGLVVDGLTACVPGRHHLATVVCQDLTFSLQPGECGMGVVSSKQMAGSTFMLPACLFPAICTWAASAAPRPWLYTCTAFNTFSLCLYPTK